MELIAIRGVMTAPGVIDMNRSGLIIVDQSRVVRIAAPRENVVKDIDSHD